MEDFRDSLQAFLSGMIDRQKEVAYLLSYPLRLIADAYSLLHRQLIATWESYQQALLKKVNPQTPQPQHPTQTEASSVNGSGTSSEESA